MLLSLLLPLLLVGFCVVVSVEVFVVLISCWLLSLLLLLLLLVGVVAVAGVVVVRC